MQEDLKFLLKEEAISRIKLISKLILNNKINKILEITEELELDIQDIDLLYSKDYLKKILKINEKTNNEIINLIINQPYFRENFQTIYMVS